MVEFAGVVCGVLKRGGGGGSIHAGVRVMVPGVGSRTAWQRPKTGVAGERIARPDSGNWWAAQGDQGAGEGRF